MRVRKTSIWRTGLRQRRTAPSRRGCSGLAHSNQVFRNLAAGSFFSEVQYFPQATKTCKIDRLHELHGVIFAMVGNVSCSTARGTPQARSTKPSTRAVLSLLSSPQMSTRLLNHQHPSKYSPIRGPCGPPPLVCHPTQLSLHVGVSASRSPSRW